MICPAMPSAHAAQGLSASPGQGKAMLLVLIQTTFANSLNQSLLEGTAESRRALVLKDHLVLKESVLKTQQKGNGFSSESLCESKNLVLSDLYGTLFLKL